jgi:hypothetical protein
VGSDGLSCVWRGCADVHQVDGSWFGIVKIGAGRCGGGEEGRIWRLVFEVGKGVKMRLLDEEEKRKVGEGRAEVEGGRWGFLPGWVKTWRAKKEVDG